MTIERNRWIGSEKPAGETQLKSIGREMKKMKNRSTEKFPPPPNLPGGSDFKSKLIFKTRTIADLQVASVLERLIPWLNKQSGRVLEVGCGAQPYRRFIPESCSYQGLDWERSDACFSYKAPDTIYYDGKLFPFEDNSFDSLFHTEVLEHIYDTDLFLGECRRVLKPGSEMLLSIPFQARYHYIPNDYWRFTPAALIRILEKAGFSQISIFTRGNDLAVAAYKNLSLNYRWLQSGILGKLTGVLILPFVPVLLALGHLSIKYPDCTGSSDDCLGYVVIAKA